MGIGTKLKESTFKRNNQINSTVTTKIQVLLKEWSERCKTQNWYPNEKNGGGNRLLEW